MAVIVRVGPRRSRGWWSALGIGAGTEVQFERGDVAMTTDEIMAITRGSFGDLLDARRQQR